MQSAVDAVWTLLRRGKYYSVRDLANISGQPRTSVADAIQFLTKYGFTERIGEVEPLFTKSKIELSPSECVRLLECSVISAGKQSEQIT
jgi:hypothetical protein